LIFLLGGARSGKSSAAVRMAASSGRLVTFIATAEAGDEEMAARIASHRAERPAAWETIEAPVDLLGAVSSVDSGRYLAVDCLTLWVSNLLGAGRSSEEILSQAREAAKALEERHAVVVSNEVGLGIVPANELARRYRDDLGSVNAIFSAAAEKSLLMIAGQALDISPVESLLSGE
jgi:adenosyl cobinamide kinase/adenosyl cobinamide phosphate guanylyltransferase